MTDAHRSDQSTKPLPPLASLLAASAPCFQLSRRIDLHACSIRRARTDQASSHSHHALQRHQTPRLLLAWRRGHSLRLDRGFPRALARAAFQRARVPTWRCRPCRAAQSQMALRVNPRTDEARNARSAQRAKAGKQLIHPLHAQHRSLYAILLPAHLSKCLALPDILCLE